jgi:2-(1,2-epoxy-1,2-dihydrophenyl)acetyl-CoA isomerase
MTTEVYVGEVLVEQRGDVLLLTLNRPDKLNAWHPGMGRTLMAAISEANADPSIGAIVMTGAGRGFCAGADVSAVFDQPDAAPGDADPSAGVQAFDWVGLCAQSKPLIAAVNGIAIGVGVTQILNFDVIVASEAARFGIGFIKMGLVPELAATRLLTQRMGPGRARMFALSGDVWSAEQALAAGLVDQVVPAESLLDGALGLAGRIAANPPPQLSWTKQLLADNVFETDLQLVQERELATVQRCFASPEHAEAIRAFMEKRAPRFR